MEKISSSETLLATYMTTPCRKPEDDTPEYSNSVIGVDLTSHYPLWYECRSEWRGGIERIDSRKSDVQMNDV